MDKKIMLPEEYRPKPLVQFHDARPHVRANFIVGGEHGQETFEDVCSYFVLSQGARPYANSIGIPGGRGIEIMGMGVAIYDARNNRLLVLNQENKWGYVPNEAHLKKTLEEEKRRFKEEGKSHTLEIDVMGMKPFQKFLRTL